VLAEGRPQQGWAVLGIGVNLSLDGLPDEVRERAGALDPARGGAEAVLAELLTALARRLAEPDAATLLALRERDALLGASVHWTGGTGTGAGIDDGGNLLVRRPDGAVTALHAGEVHLEPPGSAPGAACR
jgi:BirA family biotin operon repressor/biotin-[acetyl-CoA-carboxylase] ligase